MLKQKEFLAQVEKEKLENDKNHHKLSSKEIEKNYSKEQKRVKELKK
jgi:GTP-sensing pleiotropic transcriptional regulator CodY